MKRGSDRDMDFPQKRSRSLGFELRVLIPSRVAGSIIGKGGSNISRLRSENKAIISVPDCPGPERILSISSEDQDQVFGVLHQVVPLIEDGREENTLEIRLLYHHTEVGGIIGKGGSRIKELRATTSTQIKVYGECCPRSTDRVVAISGAVDMVLNAVKEISFLVMENPLKGPVDPYDPHNFDEQFAAQYGGFGGAEGMGMERGGRGFGGGRGGRSGYGGPPPGRGGGGAYGYDDRQDGGYHRRNDMGMGGRGGGGGYRDRGDYGGGRGGVERAPRGHDGYGGGGEETTTQVTIPKEYAGAIIGKGGTRIRGIRNDSGAKITIEEALPGAHDRVITIVGDSEQIRSAQYLLQQSVKEHGERNQF